MIDAPSAGVVSTRWVISWLLGDRPASLVRYRELIGVTPVLLAFQTVMELRCGALHGGWGELCRRRLDRRVAELAIVQPDDEMSTICAEFRHRCRQIGPALGDRVHHGDRWIAATAIRLQLPLVSHDQVFDAAPGLELVTAT